MSWPLHNDFSFPLGEEVLRVSSNFDGGNLQAATFNGTSSLTLLPGFDCLGEQSIKPSSKAFFHFRVNVLSPIRLTLRIGRVKILKRLFEDREMDQYRVCIKRKRQKEYHRYEEQPVIERDEGQQLQLGFHYTFQQKDEVYFALSFPYSYVRMVEMVRRFDTEYKNDPEIYLVKEVLTYSLEGRLVPMLTITSHENKSTVYEDRISNSMFPECIFENRPWKFRKPVILITCRVHPGETTSSYALQGLIEFLLNKEDFRATVLRRMFTFIIVPMLNPDGVHRGMYRMDTRGQNLNRFYNCAQSHKHPSIFAVRCLMSYYQSQKKLYSYIDLHGHSRRNGFFLYGNACTEYIQQVETKLFAKLMSMNCSQFNLDLCNFSQAQMVFKDAVEMLSKEGCGRVVAYKLSGITHSYAMELGLHSWQRNQLPQEANTDLKIQGLRCVDYGENRERMFTQISFKEAGRALLISMLDLLELNPYSRVINDKEKSIEGLRQQVAKEIYDKEERFKQLDPNVLKKLRNINQLTKETILSELIQRFPAFDRQNLLPRMQSEINVRKLTLVNKSLEPEAQTFTNMSMQLKEDESLTKATEEVEGSGEKEVDKETDVKAMFRNRVREFRKQLRVEKTHSLAKEVVVVNRPAPRDPQQKLNKLMKPVKIDFDPFPRFQRRQLFNFIKKQQRGELSCRDQSPLQRQSVNLPLIRPPPATSRRRSSEVEPSSPFTMQLRIRKNLEVKYGIMREQRGSLPDQHDLL